MRRSPLAAAPRGNRLASAPQCPEQRQSLSSAKSQQQPPQQPPQPGKGSGKGVGVLHASGPELRRSARYTKAEPIPVPDRSSHTKADPIPVPDRSSTQFCARETKARPTPVPDRSSSHSCARSKLTHVPEAGGDRMSPRNVVAIAHGAHVVFVVYHWPRTTRAALRPSTDRPLPRRILRANRTRPPG